MNNKYFYIGKEQALRNESLVYGMYNVRLENYKEIFGDNCIEYVGDNLPYYLTFEEDGTVREATTVELYKKGIYKLSEGEFIKDDKLYSIYDFPIPNDMIRPVFDKESLEWKDKSSCEDRVLFWKERCRSVSYEMLVLEKAGLDGDADYMRLKQKLEEFKNNYINSSHELALEMDKVF